MITVIQLVRREGGQGVTTEIEARLERLENRLAELEDERGILDTLSAYAHSLDYGDREQWMDCWTADAELKWPHWTFTGPDEIGRAFDEHSHAPQAFHKHVMIEPMIHIDGDHATASSYFARLNDSPSGPIVRSFGRYLDELRRCPDGRWRLARRVAERESLIPDAPLT